MNWLHAKSSLGAAKYSKEGVVYKRSVQCTEDCSLKRRKQKNCYNLFILGSLKYAAMFLLQNLLYYVIFLC